MVQTLVSPMSTCQRAPEDAPESLEEPRREETEPAELGLRLPLTPTLLVMPPALDVERFFLTRPPSLERKSDAADGDAGALSAVPCPKYSLPPEETGVDEIGEPGMPGELDPGT